MFSRSRAIVAAATTLQYLGSAAGGYSNAQTTVEGPPDLSRNGPAGAFNPGSPITLAFCWSVSVVLFPPVAALSDGGICQRL